MYNLTLITENKLEKYSKIIPKKEKSTAPVEHIFEEKIGEMQHYINENNFMNGYFYLTAFLTKDVNLLKILVKNYDLKKVLDSEDNAKLKIMFYDYFAQIQSDKAENHSEFDAILKDQKIFIVNNKLQSFNDLNNICKRKIEITKKLNLDQKFDNDLQREKALIESIEKAKKEFTANFTIVMIFTNKQGKPITNKKLIDLKRNDLIKSYKKEFEDKNLLEVITSFVKAIHLEDDKKINFKQLMDESISYLKSCIQQDKEIVQFFEVIIDLTYFIYVSDKSLQICKTLQSMKDKSRDLYLKENNLVSLYNKLTINYLKLKNLDLALRVVKITYNICNNSKNIVPEFHYDCVLNFAKILENYDIYGALKYFYEASNLQNSKDCSISKIYILSYLKDTGVEYLTFNNKKNNTNITIDKLLNYELHNLNDDQYKVLFLLSRFRGDDEEFKKQFEKIKEIVLNDSNLLYEKNYLYSFLNIKYSIIQDNISEAFDIFAKYLEQNCDICTSNISEIIDLLIRNKIPNTLKLNLYLNLIVNHPQLKNYENQNIKFYEFLLFNENNLKLETIERLNYLNINAFTGVHEAYLAADATEIYISTKFDEGKYHEALDYIKNEFIADEDIGQKYKILLEKTINSAGDQEIPSEEDNRNNKELEEESVDINSSIDLLPSHQLAKFLEDKKQHKINDYFKELKAKNNKKNIENKVLNASWKLNEKISFAEKSDNVCQIKGKNNYYATIDPDLNLDPVKLELYKSALAKGLVNRAKGENGIKFLGKNGFCQLKINDGDRLYITKLLKNPDGKFLIIFGKEGNHKEVGRKVYKYAPQITEVDFAQDLSFVNDEINEQKEYDILSVQYDIEISGALHENNECEG